MDKETREWLEGFEKRIDAKLDAMEGRVNAKIENTEGWLKGALEEMRCDIRDLDAKVDEGFAQVRRDINNLDRRVIRLERQRPAFVGE